jgi:hypothetical protein
MKLKPSSVDSAIALTMGVLDVRYRSRSRRGSGKPR